jgi:peptide chain release factor 3
VRLDKEVRFANPTSFMASEKNVIDEAYAGDVVGLYDTGNFKIGDTLTEGEHMLYQGIPSFSPEIFRALENNDPMKTKQLEKGIQQLTEEGVAQLFIQQPGNRKIVGTVGELQFEVIQYRLKHEYTASASFLPVNMFKACWITSDNKQQMSDFIKVKASNIAYDKDENIVYLAESPYLLKMAEQNYPDIVFHTTSEFKLKRTELN